MLEATRTYLEMTRPGELRAAERDDDRLRVEQVSSCRPDFYRRLYAEVGRDYHWVDRLAWSDAEIDAHLAQPGLTLWVMCDDGSPAGYFELRRHEDGSTEIAYFGLLPAFIGRGLGKWLLTEAVRRAWASGATRVWLHTSSLDHPAAFGNYVKRGFTPYKTEKYMVEI